MKNKIKILYAVVSVLTFIGISSCNNDEFLTVDHYGILPADQMFKTEQDGAISVREAAILQTFPLDYKFYEKENGVFSSTIIARQLGNAVPVKLGEVIAKSIKEHLKKFNDGKNTNTRA
jgi:site-specific DNA-cytosine methylase